MKTMTIQEVCRAHVRRFGTQREAAKRAGIDETYFSVLLNGRRKTASAKTLKRLGVKSAGYQWVAKRLT
jgi:DNA-binding transcriptional regulator YdaS (Cro superfamily)